MRAYQTVTLHKFKMNGCRFNEHTLVFFLFDETFYLYDFYSGYNSRWVDTAPRDFGTFFVQKPEINECVLSIEKFPANFHMEITPKQKAFVTDDNQFKKKIVLSKVKEMQHNMLRKLQLH